MAIQWSGFDASGNNAMRVGIDVSVSSVNHNTSTVTITWRVYTGNRYTYADNGQRVEYSGERSGSTTYNNTQGSGSTTLRDTFTTTHNYGSSYGSSPGKHTITATVAGTYNGSAPSKTVTVTIPARPYAAPNAPSGLSVSRTNDNRAVVSWSRNATAGRPWTRVRIQRQRNGSDWSSGSTVTGTSSTYASDTGANAYYRYRIRSENSVGNSSWVNSSIYRTSPAAPTAAKASRSGTDIRVTWDADVAYSTFTATIQRQVDGGSWSTVATGLSSSARAWRDTDTVPGGEHRYRVRNVENAVGLTSAWATTGTVATEAPPNAPTQLSPDGLTFDGSEPITLTWQHNPGADNADQTAFRIERAVAGQGDSWTYIATVDSEAQEWVAPAGTFANGTTWRWRVETKGSHADWSPKAATATLYASAPPAVQITGPDSPVEDLPPVATWTYTQQDGLLQNRGHVRLYQDDSLIQEWIVTGETASVPMAGFPFEDGLTYTVSVRARSTDGMWSPTSETSFVVDLLPPAEVTVTPTWDQEAGVVILELAAADAVPDVSAEVDFVHIQRRIDGGDWVTIWRDVTMTGGEATVLDTAPSLKGHHEWRLVVWSTAPSAAVTVPVELTTEGFGFGPLNTRWAFLSHGDGFSQIVRAQGNPQISHSGERTRASHPVAGRQDPLLLVGEVRSHTRDVSLTAIWDRPGWRGEPSSTANEWIEAGAEARIALFRDWTGRRIFGHISAVSADLHDGWADVSFSIAQTDWDENVADIEEPEDEGDD